MNDMSQVIIPRSDQINADTLMAGPMTVTIKAVKIQGGQEQPVTIMLEETDLFYRPCKSMSRCLVAAWGPDANKYVGRSLTLYRDPKVKWGGMEVGGIRISHMSHIDRDMVMALTATKGRRDPFKVRPMEAPSARSAPSGAPAKDKAEDWLAGHLAAIENAADEDALSAVLAGTAKPLAKLQRDRPELYDRAIEAAARRVDSFDDPFSNQPAAATSAAAPDAPQQSDEQAGSDHIRGVTNMVVGVVGDDDAPDTHPAVPVANRLMQRIKSCELLADLDTLVNDAKNTLAAFPDDIAETVGGLIERKRAQLRMR